MPLLTRLIPLILLMGGFSSVFSQSFSPEHLRADLDELLTDIRDNYPYLEQKAVSLECIDEKYGEVIPRITSEGAAILFFEYILDELYDNHVILNTNISWSYRLDAPIVVRVTDSGTFIVNVWQSQLENIPGDLIGAEVLSMNGNTIPSLIDSFPTRCHDKTHPEVRDWVANKVIAGRYSEPRLLALRLRNGETLSYDLDAQSIRQDEGLLQTRIDQGVGIIRINNSLGQAALIEAFDQALDGLMDTQGLILDLRNTIGGGDSYIARGLMGRFITEPTPYQQHSFVESYGNHPPIPRSWVEYVSPRGKPYTAPVIVLVGRWTGSMGEGTAIGFEGMRRAKVAGSEMRRLAGAVGVFSLSHQNFSVRMGTEKLSHLNGTPREQYVPTYFIQQQTNTRDEMLEQAMEKLREEIEAGKK